MSEVTQVPVPLINYLRLIEKKKSPYYDLICYIIADMENRLETPAQYGDVYLINPRRLRDEIEEKIQSEKLTTTNISRTILALFYGSELEKDEDYYITTSSGGRKNYHVKMSTSVLSALRMHL